MQPQPAQNKIQETCIGCVVLALIGTGAFYFLTRSPYASRDPKTEPAFTISDSDLSKAFMENEVGATTKYNGKTAIVQGFVQSIRKSGSDSEIDLGAHAVTLVQCDFSGDHDSEIAPLQTGQFISVRGIIEGRQMNVELKKCNLEQAGEVLQEAKPEN